MRGASSSSSSYKMGDAEAGRLRLKAPLAVVVLAGGEANGWIGRLA